MKAFVIAALLVVQIVAPNPWDDLLGGLTELSDADLFDLAQMGLPDELETLSSLSSVASIQLLEPEPVPQPEFLFSSDDSYVVGGQITCPGALPPQNLFPPGVSRVSYKDSLHFLCSQVGGANTFDPRGHLATRNMGCICANPGVSSDVICQAPPFSYPPIYDSDLLIQCELLCECLGKPPILKGLWFPGSPKVAESYSDSFYAFRRADGVIVALIKQPDGSIITHVLPGTKYGGVSHAHLPFNPAPGRQIRVKPPRPRLGVYRRPRPGIGGGRNDLTIMNPRRRPSKNCPARCDGWQCGSSCKCSVSKVGSQLWSPGHCISLLSGGRKKRDLGVVCACNATYVSGGCCASEDGIVHEPADYWMGRLDL